MGDESLDLLVEGTYSDPLHPGCWRKVCQPQPGSDATITGIDEVGGEVWMLKAKAVGNDLMVDFSPRGGPSEVVARWTGRGLQFPDGNLWTVAPDEPEAGETRFGRQEYWDDEYAAGGKFSDFSWYCGNWADLQPFWEELVPNTSAHVLLPGIGSDKAMVGMYDAGWQRLTAFDYAPAGVALAAEMFGDRAVDLRVADARDLPYCDACFDAVFDKGALDAVYLSGGRDSVNKALMLQRAVDELARCLRPGGKVLSVSAAASNHVVFAFSRGSAWRMLRDGDFWMTEEGIGSNNVDATLLAWERV